MRNITSTFSHVYRLPGQAVSGVSKIVKTAVNPENDELFVLTEKCDGSEEVEVEVLRALRKGSDRVLQSISLLSLPRNTFFPTPRDEPECISFRYLAEDRALCVITSGGDIALFKLEGDDFEAGNYEDSFVQGYTVGTIESGIKAASWSPDEEQVILITGDDQLVVMSREFEPMYEAPLRTEDFGEDAQINVGWGSKQTQFHGSLGKTAAQIKATRLPIGSPDDSELPTISWRGDGSYFCINSSDAYSGSSSRPGEKRRQMRIYARSPIALSATSEPIFGMEGPMSWRPMGNLIAVVQGFGWEGGAEGEGEDRGRKDVIFLERNGLQHGDFRLREDENYRGRESEIERGSTGWKVKELAYASDSEVLAVWIRKDEEDVVQLWTMNNYHYYLKQELHPSATSRITPARFTSVTWHSEKALTLYLTGEDFASERQFEWEAVASRLAMPNDTGSVAVIDGKKLLLTPFRSQNVPPPMSAYHIDLPSVPVHISFSPIDDDLGILLNNGKYLVYKLNTRILTAGARGGGAISRPIQSGQGVLKSDSTTEWRQVVLDGEGCVYGLGGSKHGEDITATSTGTFILSSSGGRLICDASGKARTMSEKGDIAVCSDLAPLEVIPFPHFCFDMVAAPEFGLLFGRESSGRLWMQLDEHKIQEKKETFSDNGSSDSGNANEVHEVTTNATSITVSSTYLIWTTTTHESKYASLDILRSIAAGNAVPESERTWETRRVERGSKIVTVIPSAMSLVLQMPRGNLESINPRALVLEVVKRDILAKRYRSAFLHCRRHRIDLNILCDVDPIVFRDDMASFVAQVKEVDYLNLFVSGLRNDDVTQTMYPRLRLARSSAASGRNKVNDICDLIRSELEKKDMIKYVDTILTTHVCKDPPDLESGLRVLLRLKSTNPGIVEDAIKYIIFLTNVNQLFDVALGMYDFQLVLMIAQYSQKDPKEYLPFLRELRELDKNYQRYRIDDHLQRWESALKHLHAGERFDEALEYIDQHELYQPAINLYQARPEELKAIYILYGENLLEKRLDYEAATAFVLGERLDRAMVAYEQAHAWRELFALAVSERTEKEALLEICERVSEYLATHSRHIEAAQIHLDYGKNVEEAVHVLCRGAAFAEATRIIALHGKSELIETTLYPGLDDAHEQFVDVFDEMEGQLDKEMNRIKELRRKVDDDPESFFMIESEPALENVDVMTNATTAVTGFTRYTAAKSAMTGTSKMSSSTRKRSRRRAAGHKGTIEEFDYLLGSLGRLVTRISEKSDEVSSVLPHLLLTSPAHRELGQELQGKVQAFREKVLLSIDKAWKHKEEVDGVRHRLIGEEEKTREIWLAAQRHAMGAQSESVQVEPEHAPAPAISKPTLASWSGKSRFL